MENNNYSDYELLKANQSPDNSNIEKMRENYIENYCKKMGWDKSALTTEQLSIIKRNKGYMNPSMLLG